MAALAAPRHGGSWLALAALCALLFLTFLDNTIVSVALGSVQAELHAGVAALQWVVNGYALTFASAMLACGMIGDEFGRKKMMIAGATVFCGGSALSALAPSAGVLIAGRVVMGLGAAASEPGTLSMLRHLYPDERRRTRAVGVWAAISGLALALGPVVGGALVGLWDWRAIFWFNLVFGVAVLALVAVVLPESADPDARRVDTAGALLGAAALVCLVFAVIHGETAGYQAPVVLGLLCLGAAAAAGFVWWERRAAQPLLDLRYLRAPRFAAANVTAFCTYFATFAIFFFTALYLVEVAGYSGYQIALVFLPMTSLMILASVLAGLWTAAAGPRWSISAGCLLFGVGLLLTQAFLRPHPEYAALAGALALAGLGIGTTAVPINTSALAAVPPQRSGMAASAVNTSREVGAVSGVAVLGALVDAQLSAHMAAALNRLGIPANFQSIVIEAIETGRVPSSGAAPGPAAAGHESLVEKVIHAAYAAFEAGLRTALEVSAALVLAAGLFAVIALRHRRGGVDPPCS